MIVVVVIVVVVLVRVLILLVDGPAGSTMCSKISIPRLRAICTSTHTHTGTVLAMKWQVSLTHSVSPFVCVLSQSSQQANDTFIHPGHPKQPRHIKVDRAGKSNPSTAIKC